ncbi:MAG: hypothetical protein L0211_04790 [Planctomycetaceae bacterium]|nr:hypothetical protein [Planctomycetaceae bacterium]
MGQAIQSRLDPVRRRQQQLRAIYLAAWGLLASSAILVVWAAGRLAGWELTTTLAVGIAIAGPALGYLVGLAWRRDWHDAAVAIDAHYRLKDRAATALEFLKKPNSTSVHKLAVADALSHLERVDARNVVPLAAPRVLPYAVGALVLAVVALVLTTRPASVNASTPAPLAVVVQSAERAAEELADLEKFAMEEKDPEIEKLVAEMKQALDELKQPGIDLREALAKLSQMQSALEQQQAKQNAGQMDTQLQATGEALALADPLAEAGKALAAAQLEKAADELEKLEAPQLDRQTEKAIQEKLDALAKQMKDSGSNSLSQAVGDISQGLGGDGTRFKDGAKRLAGEARRQGKRKKLNDLLVKQCNCLGECKGECECEGKGNGIGKGGKKWGLGASGNEAGEKTPQLGGKYESRLTGRQTDEGEIEVETTHSPEGKQEAQREYRETYDKYQKISEAVLESEPIPLGHRQTIRRYFETIRPTQGETDAVLSPAQP